MIVDVFHDTVCPWCRIGKQNLATALAGWDGPPVTVHWHPFLLNEAIPPEGLDFRAYMAANKGADGLDAMFEHVRRAGAAAGVTLNFDTIRYAPSSIPSHRLLALVPEDRQDAVLDGIHRAYFEEGRDIGRVDVLADIAAAAGLDREPIAELLRGDAARDEVIEAATWARRQGVSGVPLFIVGGALALSGAQPPATILAALRQAAARTGTAAR